MKSKSVSGTEELLESMRRDAQREALEDLAPHLGVLVAKCQEAGVALDVRGWKGAKPGRKPGRPATAQKNGAPHGEVFSEGGRGKKQCPNCGKYIGVRAGDCPNCFYNFEAAKVLAHKDADGTAIVPPANKRGPRKSAAAPVAARPANGKGRKQKGEVGKDVTDGDLDKATKAILGRNKEGIEMAGIMKGLIKHFGFDGVPGRAFQMRLLHSLRRVADKVSGTKKYVKKAA